MLKENQDTNSISLLENFAHSDIETNSSVTTVNQVKPQNKVNALFQQYKSHFFNELVDDRAMSGETCQKIEH